MKLSVDLTTTALSGVASGMAALGIIWKPPADNISLFGDRPLGRFEHILDIHPIIAVSIVLLLRPMLALCQPSGPRGRDADTVVIPTSGV